MLVRGAKAGEDFTIRQSPKFSGVGRQSMWDHDANPTLAKQKRYRHPYCSKWHTEIFCTPADSTQRPACVSLRRDKGSQSLNKLNRENNHQHRSVGLDKKRNPLASLVLPDREPGFSPGRHHCANPLFGFAPIGKRCFSFGMETFSVMKDILMPLRGGDGCIFHR